MDRLESDNYMSGIHLYISTLQSEAMKHIIWTYNGTHYDVFELIMESVGRLIHSLNERDIKLLSHRWKQGNMNRDAD